jgi:hypothetical protein
MAILKSNATAEDICIKLEHAIESKQCFVDVRDWNLANMWQDEIDSIVLYCEINAERLGLDQ